MARRTPAAVVVLGRTVGTGPAVEGHRMGLGVVGSHIHHIRLKEDLGVEAGCSNRPGEEEVGL